MFRQIKSAIIWAYIWRFRKLLFKLAIIALLIFIIQYFYADVVEYLRYSHRENKIFEALLLKWGAIVALLVIAIYFIAQALKKEPAKIMQKDKKVTIPKKLSKKEIRQRAQEIIESKSRDSREILRRIDAYTL